jgi:hypothetical protein
VKSSLPAISVLQNDDFISAHADTTFERIVLLFLWFPMPSLDEFASKTWRFAASFPNRGTGRRLKIGIWRSQRSQRRLIAQPVRTAQLPIVILRQLRPSLFDVKKADSQSEFSEHGEVIHNLHREEVENPTFQLALDCNRFRAAMTPC